MSWSPAFPNNTRGCNGACPCVCNMTRTCVLFAPSNDKAAAAAAEEETQISSACVGSSIDGRGCCTSTVLTDPTWTFIVGYGSLLSAQSAMHTLPSLCCWSVVRLTSHVRVFSLVSISGIRGGHVKWETQEAAAVALRYTGNPDDAVVAVMFAVPTSEVPAYKKREARYKFEMVDVTVLRSSFAEPGARVSGLLCLESTDEEYKAGLPDGQYDEEVAAYYDGQLWGRTDILPYRKYCNFCANAAADLGGEEWLSFMDSYVADGRTRLGTYISSFPDRYPSLLEKPTLVFIGVSTVGSSAFALIPAWTAMLGCEMRVLGVNLAHDAPEFEARLHDIMASIARYPKSLVAGALVTCHKSAAYRVLKGSADLHIPINAVAQGLQEVAVLGAGDDALTAYAADGFAMHQCLEAMLGTSYWCAHREADAVILGCGGAGLALLVELLTGYGRHLRGDESKDEEGASGWPRGYLAESLRPRRIVVTDTDAVRLRMAEDVLSGIGCYTEVSASIEWVHAASAASNSKVVASAGAGSLIVNATGLGKDRPGSPLLTDTAWPARGVAWDLNYRGSLEFLQQARAVPVMCHDGWECFLHGWCATLSLVTGRTFSTEERLKMWERASELRGASDHK